MSVVGPVKSKILKLIVTNFMTESLDVAVLLYVHFPAAFLLQYYIDTCLQIYSDHVICLPPPAHLPSYFRAQPISTTPQYFDSELRVLLHLPRSVLPQTLDNKSFDKNPESFMFKALLYLRMTILYCKLHWIIVVRIHSVNLSTFADK